MQRRIPLLTLQINIIRVPQHLQYILHISRNPFLTGQHQCSHLPSIHIPQIGPILYQRHQIRRIIMDTRVMDRFLLLGVLNVDDVGEDGEEFF